MLIGLTSSARFAEPCSTIAVVAAWLVVGWAGGEMVAATDFAAAVVAAETATPADAIVLPTALAAAAT